MAEEQQLTAAYGPWQTMVNAWQQLSVGVPPRIDRSAFPGLSWNAVTRLLGGMRFLGFIDDEGRPTKTLHDLVLQPDDDSRKALFSAVLRERYAEVFKLDLKTVTPAHLSETLGDAYNASGDTREKATRFFVAAATYAGFQLSPLFSRDRGRRPGRRQRTSNGDRKPKTATATPPPSQSVPQSGGSTRTVTLQSGGTVTLTASVDLMSLTPDDRAFVFELIDRMGAYEREGE